ncbi:MAG TPA: septal ring lytic transglycosylase RlpA family protein [Usitatibacteraceae bacterium]|nr:septal ring lytic transglycosylase RlpA family protein [Usitatibacteraceae bacterium]
MNLAQDCPAATHGFIQARKDFAKRRTFSALGVGALAILLAACASPAKKSEPQKTPTTARPGAYYLDDGPGDSLPPNLDAIADAVPRPEPLHRGANKPYTVFGKTYVPNVAADPFRQEGIASWYGRKFHGNPTSIGEPYDMYGMSAAHPTLPLPSYVRVTNPANMKSVIVRVNDRGPFHSDRIIDLSYMAAAKLDIARKGSGRVIVERIFPGQALAAPVATPAAPPALAPPAAPSIVLSPISGEAGSFYLQLGAFSSRDNAENFRVRMARELDWNREPIQLVPGDGWFRVRMGPYATRDEAEAIAAQVRQSHDFSPTIQKQ